MLVLSAICINDKKQILLVKLKKDDSHWVLPGGKEKEEHDQKTRLLEKLQEKLPQTKWEIGEIYGSFCGEVHNNKIVVTTYFVKSSGRICFNTKKVKQAKFFTKEEILSCKNVKNLMRSIANLLIIGEYIA